MGEDGGNRVGEVGEEVEGEEEVGGEEEEEEGAAAI